MIDKPLGLRNIWFPKFICWKFQKRFLALDSFHIQATKDGDLISYEDVESFQV